MVFHWCSYNKQNITCPLMDMNFIFSWSTRVDHWKIKFISTRGHVISSISLLYGGECFTGNYTTRRFHTPLHPGPEWRIFRMSPLWVAYRSMTSRFPPFAFVELVSPCNKKNITRWLEDMNFMFSWREQYLTHIFSPPCNILYTSWSILFSYWYPEVLSKNCLSRLFTKPQIDK